MEALTIEFSMVLLTQDPLFIVLIVLAGCNEWT